MSETTNSKPPIQAKTCASGPDAGSAVSIAAYYSDPMSSSNGHPRVVISGIGVVSPLGLGRECFWHHVSRGASGTKAITQFDVSRYPCRVAAWVPPVSIDQAAPLEGDSEHDARADPKHYSRAALYGVLAAREAWQDAGLRAGEQDAGVLIGSGRGGGDVGERQDQDLFVNERRDGTPDSPPQRPPETGSDGEV